MSGPVESCVAGEKPKPGVFLSYGRADARDLADRVKADVEARGFRVWQDRAEIAPGEDWRGKIVEGLRHAQVMVALLTPHSVRSIADPHRRANTDSVCLDEISYARSRQPPLYVVPVMAIPCEVPFDIYRLHLADMCRWQESEAEYQAGLADVLRGIEAALRGEVRYDRWSDQLKPFDFGPFLYEKRHLFCGREWLFGELDAWRVASTSERALLILGDPGVGKSALVAELVHRNPDGQVLAYHCCQADTIQTLEPARFVRSLAAMIASKLEGYAGQLENPSIQEALGEARAKDDPIGALDEGILGPLHKLPGPIKGPRYILVDALDEALAGDRSITIVELLAARLDRLPGWLRIVATTRKEPDVLQRLRRLRPQELDAQDPRNLQDVDCYVAARLQSPDLAERLVTAHASAERVVASLRKQSQGNFLYVREALDGIERDQHGFDDLDTLPPGLSGLYQKFFERYFPDDARYALAKRVLQVVVAAPEPLTEEQLAAATELDPEEQLPAVLRCLAVYLPKRIEPDGSARYAVFHQSLTDWLTGPDLRGTPYYASAKRGHERLAALCWAEYREGAPGMPRYALSHLPAHLTAATRWGDLEQALTALPYLEAKSEIGLVFELAGDFTTALAALPPDRPQRRVLQLLEEAIRRDVHFIARHFRDYPQALFQCLWNTCSWYDSPEVAAHYEPPLGGWTAQETPGAPRGEGLYALLKVWRKHHQRIGSRFCWLRSLRPPEIHLGTAQRAVIRGHENWVRSVAYSKDGQLFATGSHDRTVRVWSAKTGKPLECFEGHQDHVSSVAFSPDGRYLASGAEDKTVRLWDLYTKQEAACLRGHADIVTSVAFSPRGNQIVSGSQDYSARIWEVHGGEVLHTLLGHDDFVHSVTFSPQGHHVATGGTDATVRVWDARTGGMLHCLTGHENTVTCVAYSPDARYIVSASRDETLRIWDVESGVELACIRAHTHMVHGAAFSPDGRRIVSGSSDGTVRLWDVATGEEVFCFEGHEGLVTCVAYSPDGHQVLSGASDGTVRVWDAQGGAVRCRLRGHQGRVTCLAFSASGDRLASGSLDKTVHVWDTRTGAGNHVLRGHNAGVYKVAFLDEEERVASWSADRQVRIWDAGTGHCVQVLTDNPQLPTIATGASQSRRRASVVGSETVIEDAERGRIPARFPLPLRCIVAHPVRQVWAGAVGKQIHLLAFEDFGRP